MHDPPHPLPSRPRPSNMDAAPTPTNALRFCPCWTPIPSSQTGRLPGAQGWCSWPEQGPLLHKRPDEVR